LDAAAGLRGARISNETYAAYTERILTYAMARKNVKFVTGHFVFSETVYREFAGEYDFITVLRHPVSRWFSQYFFNRHKNGDHFKTDMDIHSYLQSREGISSARTLIATLAPYAYDESDPTECMRTATANLEKFAIVGCVENLKDFKEQLRTRYNVDLRVPSLNQNPLSRSAQKDMITDDLRSRVAELCRYDMEVYEHAFQKLSAKPE
jgi:hypothetical protein